jgi:ketosteroid isomerase-like protein
MKLSYRCICVVLPVVLLGCHQQQRILTDTESKAIEKEVSDQFSQLVSAVNQLNADAWSRHYSKDDFISAIVSTDYYGARSAWVDTITKYFSMRERQSIKPLQVRVTALAPGLALMTSEEKGEVSLKDGSHTAFKHVFTMIWKKEHDGWKILHSHESMN